MSHLSTADWTIPTGSSFQHKTQFISGKSGDDSPHPARFIKQMNGAHGKCATPGTSCYCSIPPTQPQIPSEFGKHTLQTHSPVLSSLLPARAALDPIKHQHRWKTGIQHILLNFHVTQVTGGAPKRLKIVGIFSLNRAKKRVI